MKKIFVTYFEPFGGRTTNASKEVVSLLSDYHFFELPVSWEKVPSIIDKLLNDKPDYLFLIGEAGSYKEITIEKMAHNIAHGIDNYKISKDNECIIKNAPNALTTALDLSNIPYKISEDAGKYLCNFSYYFALTKTTNTKVLFIHLPYINENVNLLKEQLLDIIKTLSK